MNQTRAFALICAVILALSIVALALLIVFGELGLTLHGSIALMLGTVLTMALAMLLMGLMFFSDRSGRDQSVFDRKER